MPTSEPTRSNWMLSRFNASVSSLLVRARPVPAPAVRLAEPLDTREHEDEERRCLAWAATAFGPPR